MAEVDKDAESILVHLPGVVRAVRQAARDGAKQAEVNLAAHRSAGHTRITVSFGVTDAFVSLDDTRGQSAAAAIEFGRSGGARGSSQGLHILGRAF